jgi:hypothetical protein
MSDFLRRVQRYVAHLAVTTSVFRAKGSAGAMRAAIDFVSVIDLELPQQRCDIFGEFLDEQTEALRAAFPLDWRPWGPARKVLNVFLRDASYNAFLRQRYNLGVIEALLEAPIDSQIAQMLHRQIEGRNLPRWVSIIGLTPDQHREYQIAASGVAKRLGTFPTHLDLWFWRPMTDNNWRMG